MMLNIILRKLPSRHGDISVMMKNMSPAKTDQPVHPCSPIGYPPGLIRDHAVHSRTSG